MKNERGSMLIGIMFGILILGLLAAMAGPTYLRARTLNDHKAAMDVAKALYTENHSQFFKSLQDTLTTPGYIFLGPIDDQNPVAGAPLGVFLTSDDRRYSFEVVPWSTDNFKVDVHCPNTASSTVDHFHIHGDGELHILVDPMAGE